jgi:serine-type D-Ala-D-Ala carboxypeptidase/endopeptidase
MAAFIGAGGIVSTPNDMMLYLEYNLGLLETPLNSLLPALHTPATTVTTSSGSQLALGWFIGTLAGSSIQAISKDGAVQGFATQIEIAPSTATGVLVLTNITTGKGQGKTIDVQKIASQILQIINGLSPTEPAPSDDQP